MTTFRFGLDPDEHGDFIAGITRVQVAEPPAPPAGFNAPNPNASPVYALFQAGHLEIRVDGDEDFDTRVGRPILENGTMTKRDLINKLNGITEIRDYYRANPNPDHGIGGFVKAVQASEVTEMVSGAVLDELHELRQYKAEREAEERARVAAPRPVRTIEQMQAEATRTPLQSSELIAGLGKRKRCDAAGCGKWTNNLTSHVNAVLRNGKKLVPEHLEFKATMQAAKEA